MKNIFKRVNSQKLTDERLGPLLGEALGSLPQNGECPPPEDIAALSENKIGGKERERLLLHLAGCDRCRTAYSMVCEIALGAEPAAGTDYRWQARRLVPLAAAAGLILVIVSWPLLEHRNNLVPETASPYIQKPAAAEPEKTVTELQKSIDTSKDRRSGIKEAKPIPAAEAPAKEKMERTPVPTGQAISRPEAQSVRPADPMPAMGSSKLMAPGMTEAPRPAAKAEGGTATPAVGGSSLGLSRQATEAPRPSYELEPRFIAAPITKRAESPAEPLNLHRRVEIDKEQKLRLSKADAATIDKVKIGEIFKDLKLGTCGFPLQDINKVVVQWTYTPQNRGKAAIAESGGQDRVQADISLEEGGVLMIDIQGAPPLRKNRGAKISVGC
jgi:hypothetical protein